MHRKEYHTRAKQVQPKRGKNMVLHFDLNRKVNLGAMQRKINRLERILAQRESEVWTLKNLLLYR